MQKLRCLIVWVLIGGVLTCPALAAFPFPDVDENADYAEAVEYLKDAGIMRGDDKGNFNPNNPVTRAEMATIICNMLGETEGTASSVFTDVPIGHWANHYISKAAELGIISGYGNGKFGPSDNITYEQGVTMIVRALGGTELATNAGGYPYGFLDVAYQHGFLENITATEGEPLLRKDVAYLLYNSAYFSFSE